MQIFLFFGGGGRSLKMHATIFQPLAFIAHNKMYITTQALLASQVLVHKYEHYIRHS